MRTPHIAVVVVVVACLFASISSAAEWFVAPDGVATNRGTKESPWDLVSAVSGRQTVNAGDTVFLRGGKYKGKFEFKLAGKPGAPVHVRPVAGERATIIDSSTSVVAPADHLWIRDLEITGSTPVDKRISKERGSHPKDLADSDGLNIHAGSNCKFINLVIHDNVRGGVGWWVGSTDSELYGCIIYDNGWVGPDRGHGHCIYVQNKRGGTKAIDNCILTVPHDGSYTMHAYGSSRAFVDDFVIRNNIAFARGPFLVGGGAPSHGIKVTGNCLHGVPMMLGYGAENEDCEVRDNVAPRGINIRKFKRAVDEGNVREMPASRVMVLPNRYDPDRAHVAVYNGAKAAEVSIDVSKFLKRGERYRVMRAMDIYGKPVVSGTCDGEVVRVPAGGEFSALVVFKER